MPLFIPYQFNYQSVPSDTFYLYIYSKFQNDNSSGGGKTLRTFEENEQILKYSHKMQ